MKKYDVIVLWEAEEDLRNLYLYIADKSGTFVSNSYIDRIRAACASLAIFPQRGTSRDEIRPGLRIIGFERSASIAFRVLEDHVEILRIFYGGRDYARIFRDPSVDE